MLKHKITKPTDIQEWVDFLHNPENQQLKSSPYCLYIQYSQFTVNQLPYPDKNNFWSEFAKSFFHSTILNINKKILSNKNPIVGVENILDFLNSKTFYYQKNLTPHSMAVQFTLVLHIFMNNKKHKLWTEKFLELLKQPENLEFSEKIQDLLEKAGESTLKGYDLCYKIFRTNALTIEKNKLIPKNITQNSKSIIKL